MMRESRIRVMSVDAGRAFSVSGLADKENTKFQTADILD